MLYTVLKNDEVLPFPSDGVGLQSIIRSEKVCWRKKSMHGIHYFIYMVTKYNKFTK